MGRPPPHALTGHGVAVVPQRGDVVPLLTVRTERRDRLRLPPAPRERTIPDDGFALFRVLETMQHRRGDLSGGQQQQLAIARALITRPERPLMDAPTEGIQPHVIDQVGEVIAHLAPRGADGDPPHRAGLPLRRPPRAV